MRWELSWGAGCSRQLLHIGRWSDCLVAWATVIVVHAHCGDLQQALQLDGLAVREKQVRWVYGSLHHSPLQLLCRAMQVGYVQTRWAFTNPEESYLTKVVRWRLPEHVLRHLQRCSDAHASWGHSPQHASSMHCGTQGLCAAWLHSFIAWQSECSPAA